MYEVHDDGIKMTLVEPGFLRDDDSDGTAMASTSETTDRPASSSSAPRIKRYGHFEVKAHTSPAYSSSTSPAGHAQRMFQWLGRRQPTSVVKSAELVWQLAHCSYPPLRLILGNYAVESIRDRLRCITEEIEDWKFLSFPEEEGARSYDDDPFDQDVEDDEEQEDDQDEYRSSQGDAMESA